MKLLLFLLTTSALVLWVGLAPVQAEDFALNFDPPGQPSPPPPPEPPTPRPSLPPEQRPLPIPSHGTRPPMRFHSPNQLPSGVNRQAVAVALNEGHAARDVLPPVPPRLAPEPAVVEAPAAEATPPDTVAAIPPEPAPKADDGILSFGVDSTADRVATVTEAEPGTPPTAPPPVPGVSRLFEGGSQSLVARAVGSAEGTRTATGGFTPAYQGHTDPGNQAWNMGTFSYQHGATSAEDADRKQLKRLQSQTEVLERRALNRGLSLTLEETLNGIDLANQSPLASIGRVGYIERLAEVRTWGLEGTEAIVVARTRSYLNPNTGRWNAPGLGNTEASITRDQRRRTDAIARALAAYRLEYPHLNLTPTLVTIAPPDVLAAVPPPAPLPVPEPEPDTVPVQFATFSENLPSETLLAATSPPENPSSDSSSSENPSSENSLSENLSTGSPSTENPLAENSSSANLSPENSLSESSSSKNPSSENSLPEDPSTRSPSPENPRAENSSSENPSTASPSTEVQQDDPETSSQEADSRVPEPADLANPPELANQSDNPQASDPATAP